MPHKTHIPAVGSRYMVMHGNAKHTSGGLKKEDLKYKVSGGRKIVSKKVSQRATRTVPRELALWRSALKERGALRKGQFIAVSKKHTPAEYNAVMAIYESKLGRR
jgi:hypothetical protein